MTADSVTAPPRSGAEYAETASAAYRAMLQVIESVEPRIAEATRKELADQRDSLKLIASENYASPAVLLTMGTWLSDKYAEGTIGHRFYAGCQNVDTVEAVAAEHAARAVRRALRLRPAALRHRRQPRRVLGHPGHPRRGARPGRSGRQARQRPVRGRLGEAARQAGQPAADGHVAGRGRPPHPRLPAQHLRQDVPPAQLRHRPGDRPARLRRRGRRRPASSSRWCWSAGYSAYPRRVNFAKMREIADEVGATLMVDMAHFAGLVAGKVFTGDEDPVPHAHVTTTTTHKSLRGPRGGLVLATAEYADAVDKGCPMVLGGPLSHVMAAKAVALAEARQPSFQAYAQQVADNAKALAEGFLKRGARLVTGGTDNHIVLLDVTSFGLTGRQAESALLDSGVVTNRNSIPADPNGAWYSSGIRFGTPALTTRGSAEVRGEAVLPTRAPARAEKDRRRASAGGARPDRRNGRGARRRARRRGEGLGLDGQAGAQAAQAGIQRVVLRFPLVQRDARGSRAARKPEARARREIGRLSGQAGGGRRLSRARRYWNSTAPGVVS